MSFVNNGILNVMSENVMLWHNRMKYVKYAMRVLSFSPCITYKEIFVKSIGTEGKQ